MKKFTFPGFLWYPWLRLTSSDFVNFYFYYIKKNKFLVFFRYHKCYKKSKHLCRWKCQPYTRDSKKLWKNQCKRNDCDNSSGDCYNWGFFCMVGCTQNSGKNNIACCCKDPSKLDSNSRYFIRSQLFWVFTVKYIGNLWCKNPYAANQNNC